MPSRVGLFLYFVLLLTGCASLENWHSGPRRVFETKAKWVKNTNQEENLRARKINRMKPILFGDFVIQSNGLDGISAYRADNGVLQWQLGIVNGAEPSATLINDRLFVGGGDGQFYSVDAKTGKVLWTFPTRIETLAEPLLHEGVLYILTGNNTLYALEADSGKQLWLYSRQDPSSLSIRGGSRPAIRNGTIYVGFSDGAVVALLASNGALKWEKQLSRNKKFKDLDSDPLIEGDYLYILGYDDSAYCLRAATGDVVWKNEFGGYGSILRIEDYLYFASTNGSFVSVHKETGVKKWVYPIKDGIATSASQWKGLLFFGESQGDLVVVDAATGKKISSFTPGRGLLSPPLIDEKRSQLYFISNEANLFSLSFGWVLPKHLKYLD